MKAAVCIWYRYAYAALGIAATTLAIGCSSATPAQSIADASNPDTGNLDAGGRDAAEQDAAAQDAGYPHVYGTAKQNEACEVNATCGRGLRCECSAGACACKTGVRGEGRAGVDPCTNENDCGTAICIERTGAPSVCSGYCKTPADCGAKLPRCLRVAGLAENICSPPAPN